MKDLASKSPCFAFVEPKLRELIETCIMVPTLYFQTTITVVGSPCVKLGKSSCVSLLHRASLEPPRWTPRQTTPPNSRRWGRGSRTSRLRSRRRWTASNSASCEPRPSSSRASTRAREPGMLTEPRNRGSRRSCRPWISSRSASAAAAEPGCTLYRVSSPRTSLDLQPFSLSSSQQSLPFFQVRLTQ